MDFTGKNVLITGGARGIGRATAIAFAEKGARVAVNFRNDSQAAGQTIEKMRGEGHFAVRADISHPSAVERMVDAVAKEMGRIHILVNNAGIFHPHPLPETDYQSWQKAWQEILNTNLIGAANVCYCVSRHMMEQGGGRIVNVSSRGAFRGEPNAPAYGASKAGMNAMSQSLAFALAPYRIFVGAVAPGFVASERILNKMEGEAGEEIRRQSPLQRIAEPEEVAHAILFLASEGAEFTTGAILDINGASYLRS